MQNVFIRATVATSLMLASLAATAAPSASSPAGGFVDAGIGKAFYSLGARGYDGKSDFSYSLTGGYRWAAGDDFAIGIEGGYADLGTITYRERGTINYGRGGLVPYEHASSLGSRAVVVGSNAKWQWAPSWSLTGRVGVARTMTKYHLVTKTGSSSSKYQSQLSRGSVYVGLGLGYAVSKNMDVTLNVAHYSLAGKGFATRNQGIGVTTYGMGAAFRF